MEIYVLIIEDHHTDVDVQLFKNKDVAINKARDIAFEYDECEEETYYENCSSGLIYSAIYSCEGDSVTVKKCKLDESEVTS